MKKEREMNDFLDKFDDNKEQEEIEIDKLQGTIETSMEQLSEIQNLIENIPDIDKAKRIDGDLNFKTNQMELSKITLEKLKLERQRLNNELKKINTLDSRLLAETNN